MRIILRINAKEMMPLQSINICAMYPLMRIIQDINAELKVSR